MATALITGASSGIGLEFAKLFARAGDDLVLVARSEKRMREIADELQAAYKVIVHVIAADLAVLEEVNSVYESCRQHGIVVNYLINNAGFGDFGLFYQTDLKRDLDMIQVNITALTILTKLFVKDMVIRGEGKILNIGSNGSFVSGPSMAVYCATKNYVLAFTEALAVELDGTGVTATCLCPGPTTSGFQKAAGNENSKLVKGKKLASSADVALFGYKAMMKGKMTVIHGSKTKLEIFSTRFTPRKLVARIAHSQMKA
jgi:hypothetical protein